ncbi:helix-turn-helix transcriptional regulator [Shewanella atlantica]|uniref:LuxR family transcriptional regulator n=1 Tax=Shewanella atlantica TaxID=271099 RepID=A0A3S0IGS1_9GAMM|nr:LuxR C-terminal-related transcriptional regulator [Shewanella atlantica]RTR33596.1 LuxR family transcriptional regulator [Shewanella atlantica]
MKSIITKPCDIDPEHIRLASEFLAEQGVTEFFYGITTKTLMPATNEFKKLRRRMPKEMLKARYGIYSSDNIRIFRHRYLQHFASSDEAYFDKNLPGPNIWRDPDYSGAKGEQFKRLMDEYGIVSRALWLLPVKYNPDWYAVFVLFSPLDKSTLSRNIITNREQINYQLQLYSSLFNEQCIAQLNPISNFNCLSPKALQVLELTAQGFSCEEIGEKLVMTESGVHYHQNRLKELFNAKNRAQLVSFAHSLGVLD